MVINSPFSVRLDKKTNEWLEKRANDESRSKGNVIKLLIDKDMKKFIRRN